MDTLLDINNLSVSFNNGQSNVTAVKSISFQIYKGEIVCLVGESGSGKSVAANSVMRLLDESKTMITADRMSFMSKSGECLDILQLPKDKLPSLRGQEIGMIFQEPMTSLNPVIKCGDQVAEGLLIHGLESTHSVKDKVLELFKEVGLDDSKRIFDSYPHQLSGGQKQRIMIAMAMACNPSLLIADEPTTALDVTVQKKILEALKELCRNKGMAMLFISHDLNIVKQLADKILVMYKGEIVEQGSTLEVFNHPKHPYTKGLLSCRPPLKTKLRILPTLSDFIGNTEAEKPYATRLSDNNIITRQEHESAFKSLSSVEPILKIKHVTTSFTQAGMFFWNKKKVFKAIQDISFVLYPGEVLGLVGESGSGKSTLGRTICRLLDSESGSVTYRNIELANMPENEFRVFRKNIQIIFQDPYASLNPSMKAGDAILEPMIVHKLCANKQERIEKVYSLLESVGLPAESFHKYPHEFSGGQRQRISIARALSLNPEILICDESVSALDVNVQAQVLNLLNELRSKFNLSMIFITHDLSVVRFICDRVMVMKNGRLEEIGTVEQVMDNPASDYTRLLLESVPE
ncbi:MAG TPA: ABC transporter ATP-binding protein [Saprospiraceae bacterium]|nr:ABC transporter ATP-binding protein [Saprospiraceae bacterium]